MFLRKIVHRTATIDYPKKPAVLPERARGRPDVDLARCAEDEACVKACPTQAIALHPWQVDMGACIFCGICADACPSQAIQMTQDFELAVHQRESLVLGEHGKHVDGIIRRAPTRQLPMAPDDARESFAHLTEQLQRETQATLKRSLHVRHLDAGSCNGCDWEMTHLLNPVYDIQRLGIDFVASPRHADVLLVTGVMTRNLTMAAIRAYQAMPEPRLVVAIGACACSGGVFASGYAGGGGTDTVLPVDFYIPGCPPRPEAMIQGLLLAMGRIKERLL